MTVTIHHVVQGSPAWLALRAGKNTASEAPAMKGASKRISRNDLLHMKATGTEQEFSAWAKKNLIDNGHAAEARARAIAEELIGAELFPATITNTTFPTLLASPDGITEDLAVVWESKLWNKEKAAWIEQTATVPPEDLWQVEQHLLLTNAEKALYMVTDGTKKNTVYCWHYPTAEAASRLLDGWQLFDSDLATYAPQARVEVVAGAITALPAITYRLNGLALTSNLEEFRKAAEQLVADSKLPLTTDQDFADREALCKSFAEAEGKIALMKEQVIAEVKDIDTFTRALGEIGELIRQARLAGEKQVKARKDDIRLEIKLAAETALAKHVQSINAAFTLEGVTLPRIDADFAAAMKNKRSLKNLQDAVDEELARAKLAANQWQTKIAHNLGLLATKGKGHEFLFRDANALVQKDYELLDLLIDQRVREHQDREAEKERQREAEARQQQAEDAAGRTAAAQAAQGGDWEPPAEQGGDDSRGHRWGTRTLLDKVGAAPAAGFGYDPGAAEGDISVRVQVTDKRALLQAVLDGEVPAQVLVVDMAYLSVVCAERRGPVPGVTYEEH